MSVDLERTDRGRKPLISLGVNFQGVPFVDFSREGVHPR
jgi:hypothetical protein